MSAVLQTMVLAGHESTGMEGGGQAVINKMGGEGVKSLRPIIGSYERLKPKEKQMLVHHTSFPPQSGLLLKKS